MDKYKGKMARFEKQTTYLPKEDTEKLIDIGKIFEKLNVEDMKIPQLNSLNQKEKNKLNEKITIKFFNTTEMNVEIDHGSDANERKSES